MTSFRIVTTILLLHSKYGINLTQSFTPTRIIGHHHHHHQPKLMNSLARPSHCSSPRPVVTQSLVTVSSRRTTTILSATKKKLSASEKRKRRGKKLAPKVPKMEPHGLPRPDVWDKTTDSSSTNANNSDDDDSIYSPSSGGDAVKAQAKSLIDVQRKSVATLTHVKNSIDALPPRSTLQAALSSTSDDNNGVYHIVIDNFLNDDELCSEMAKEGRSMLDAMELDLESGGICGGQFGTAIVGGKEQYVECPRCVEYVVSLTRHLPGSLYDEDEKEEEDLLGFRLDSAASMAGIRTFDRNARVSALKLLNVEEDEDTNPVRPFDYVVDGKTPDDRRKVTALYFMVPDNWNTECGGGMRIKTDDDTEVLIEAKRDRLLIFRSDKCLHHMEGWVGSEGEGLDVGSHIKTHFVQS